MICITDCVVAQCLIAPNPCADAGYSADPNNIIIGALEPDTDYTLYIEDLNSQVLKPIQLTSDGDGNITFDMNDYPGFFHPGTKYKCWVTIEGAGLTDVEDITFGPYDIYSCLLLEFRVVSEDSETLFGLTNQTVML